MASDHQGAAVKECELRRHVLSLGIPCDEDECIFWTHLGPEGGEQMQCAVQYFQLLGPSGQELAAWLLSLKQRTDVAEILGLGRETAAAQDEL